MKALLPLSIFSQIFFVDYIRIILLRIFISNVLSQFFFRIFFQLAIGGFSFKYSLSDSNLIYFHGLPFVYSFVDFFFEYSFTDFLSNFLSRSFYQYSFSDFLSNNLCGLSFIYGYAGPCKNQLTVVLSDGIVTQRRFSLKHSSWIFFRIFFR